MLSISYRFNFLSYLVDHSIILKIPYLKNQLTCLEKLYSCFSFFAIALDSYTQQRLCVNSPIYPIRKQDEFANAQSQAKRSNISSNKIFTPFKACTPLKAPTLLLLFLFIKIFFTNL